jgi:hypothetical protein
MNKRAISHESLSLVAVCNLTESACRREVGAWYYPFLLGVNAACGKMRGPQQALSLLVRYKRRAE